MDSQSRQMNYVREFILRRQLGPVMATGGAVMAPGDKMDTGRDMLGIQGQGLNTARSQDGSLSVPNSERSSSNSRPSTATSGEQAEAIGSFSMPPEAVGVLETVINMNKALEQQIEALRLRLTVEAKNHDTERNKIVHEKNKELSKKENEVCDLKDSIVRREERIGGLVKESREKDLTIQQKEKEITDLKELVKNTEDYAEQLQKRIGKLKGDKQRLEADPLYKEHHDEVRKLRHEIVSMKDKINSMEKELGRAKLVIEQQSTKIKGLESEKGALSDKFKEELERASRAMRSEVERMREVMKQQYEEMRNLREQNIEISSDVRDIKDILLKGAAKPEPVVKQKTSEKLDVNAFKSPRPVQKSPNFGMRAPMTSRQITGSKPGTTVRTSLPAMTHTSKTAGHQNGLPPITKTEPVNGRWIPAGTKPATVTVKSARGRRK